MAVTTVDEYIIKHPEWREELNFLRETVLSSGLVEQIKWGAPTYSLGGKNVIGLGAFKSYCGIWFFQGALLKDMDNVLMNAQEGKTQAMRQWRFANLSEIESAAEAIQSYVKEAVENQEQGKVVGLKPPKPLSIPEELVQVLSEQPNVKFAFQQLSIAKQREFAEYISEAKKPETKIKRLEKIIPMIEQGIGLSDKYRK